MTTIAACPPLPPVLRGGYGGVVDHRGRFPRIVKSDLSELPPHGRRPLENRRAFLQSLFPEEGLRENSFSYLSEVRSLLQTEACQDAQLPYRRDD